MLQPAFYPHLPDEVTSLQTHISYVFLAGEEVYKVKKPVRFSFLDFSTLERRHQICREEVHLNRRLAPDMYRGVVAICGSRQGYRLGDEADPEAIEYAVQMRRLPEERILSNLLDRRQVTSEMIDRLAAHLAKFHAAAQEDPEVIENGSAAAILRILEDNFSGARSFRGNTIAAEDDDIIQEFCRGFVEDHRELLSRRQKEQRIRDGHGDLHSEHICFGEKLEIFDCIEFNSTFRYCDVASEIAFLAMDLDYHKRQDLSVRLVDRYAELTNDPDLAHLIPFYQCHRAYVRGKVDSLKSAEEEVEKEDRAAALQSARSHFQLAYRYTWAYKPALIAVVGLSGSGKTTIATALQDRTGFTHLNTDVVRKRLAGVTFESPRPGEFEAGLYSPERSRKTYDALFSQAESIISRGGGVILDATFQRRRDREHLQDLAKRHGIMLLLVGCKCDPDNIRARLKERTHRAEGPSDADWDVYLQQLSGYEHIDSAESEQLLELDTTEPTQATIARIEEEMRRRNNLTNASSSAEKVL